MNFFIHIIIIIKQIELSWELSFMFLLETPFLFEQFHVHRIAKIYDLQFRKYFYVFTMEKIVNYKICDTQLLVGMYLPLMQCL